MLIADYNNGFISLSITMYVFQEILFYVEWEINIIKCLRCVKIRDGFSISTILIKCGQNM